MLCLCAADDISACHQLPAEAVAGHDTAAESVNDRASQVARLSGMSQHFLKGLHKVTSIKQSSGLIDGVSELLEKAEAQQLSECNSHFYVTQWYIGMWPTAVGQMHLLLRSLVARQHLWCSFCSLVLDVCRWHG